MNEKEMARQNTIESSMDTVTVAESRLGRLLDALEELRRSDEMIIAVSSREYREKLYEEFGIGE